MNKNLNSALGITAAALVLGGGLAWWITRPDSASNQSSTSLPSTNLLTTTNGRPTLSARRANAAQARTNRTGIGQTTLPGTDATSWEDRLDEILVDESTDEVTKGKQLLAMIPRLDEEAQLEVIQHVVNLVDDASYEGAIQILTNELYPESVLSVLMTDLMNRKNTLKLNTLLHLAKNQEHPHQGEARDLLEFYVEEDYGADWTKWEGAVQKWLKENPDDEPEAEADAEKAADPTPKK